MLETVGAETGERTFTGLYTPSLRGVPHICGAGFVSVRRDDGGAKSAAMADAGENKRTEGDIDGRRTVDEMILVGPMSPEQ